MKKLVCLLLCFVIFAMPVMSLAQEAEIKVFLNGTALEFPDAKPVIKDGRTIVPMRAIFEALGAGVYWEETDRMIMSQRNGKFIIMQIDSDLMFVNDQAVTLEVAPTIMESRTMVPLRAISESFGLKVEWDGDNRTVIITE